MQTKFFLTLVLIFLVAKMFLKVKKIFIQLFINQIINKKNQLKFNVEKNLLSFIDNLIRENKKKFFFYLKKFIFL